jgi:hypothetical protein
MVKEVELDDRAMIWGCKDVDVCLKDVDDDT